MTMRFALRLLASSAACLVCLATGLAHANMLEVSETRWRVIWPTEEPLRIQTSAGTIACEVTLEGELAESVFTKTTGELIGTVERAQRGECAGGEGEILAETLPWRIYFDGWNGALPVIGDIRVSVVGMGMSGTISGVECLLETTLEEPARLILSLNEFRKIILVLPDNATLIHLTGGFFCGFANLAILGGNGFMTDGGEELIELRLI